MSQSIMQKEKCCYVCGSEYALESHHCLHGTGNRSLAEHYGLKVYLCVEHHRGNSGAHNNAVLDVSIKEDAQRAFETAHPDLDFLKIFGKNYL